MKNQNLLDQFVLKDEVVLNSMIFVLEPKCSDIILEIGAGSGVITKVLAKKIRKIVAVEIDKNFENELKRISGNIQLIFDDALKVLKDQRKYKLRFHKIVGSLPSSLVEPLMHVLKKVNFDLAVFLVPLKFVSKLIDQPTFNIYFDVSFIQKVSRYSFSPVPKTNWALVRIVRKPSPLKTGEMERFLWQYLCEHPKAKVKNALAEGIIKFFGYKGKPLTKKQARTIIATKNPLSMKKLGGGFK